MWYTSEIKELEKLGFSRKYYEKGEHKDFYYSKHVKSRFFNRLSIQIHFDSHWGKYITVECFEPTKTKLDKANCPVFRGAFILYNEKYSLGKLNEVINYFRNETNHPKAKRQDIL